LAKSQNVSYCFFFILNCFYIRIELLTRCW